jgi:hypothetical protein
MISSKLGAITFIAAIGIAAMGFALPIAAIGVASPAFAQAGDYTYHAREGAPIRNPNPWANDYRLKHHPVRHHLHSSRYQ